MTLNKKYFYSKIFLFIYVTTIITLSYQPAYSDISQLIGIALVIMFLLESMMLKKRTFLFPIPLIYYLIFLIVLLVSSIFVNGEYAIILTVFQLIILSFIIINIIGFTGYVWPITMGISLGTLILNYQVWSHFDYTFNLNGLRMDSDFINANSYSMYLSIGILVFIYIHSLFTSRKVQVKKQLSIFIRIILIILIIFYSYIIINVSGSKKGILGLILIFVSYLLFEMKKRNLYLKMIYIFTLPFIFIITSNILKDTLGFKRLSTTDTSINQRSEMIEKGFELWSDKPFIGWGVNQFRRVSGFNGYSHNNYIEILANSGLIGFAVYYSIFLSLLITIFKLYNTVNKNTKAVLFWCLLVIFTILLWDIGLVSYYSKLIWLIISMVIGVLILIKKEKIDKLH